MIFRQPSWVPAGDEIIDFRRLLVKKKNCVGWPTGTSQNVPLNCVGLTLQNSLYAPFAINNFGSDFKLNTL
jgi:hypothetical protein